MNRRVKKTGRKNPVERQTGAPARIRIGEKPSTKPRGRNGSRHRPSDLVDVRSTGELKRNNDNVNIKKTSGRVHIGNQYWPRPDSSHEPGKPNFTF